MELEIDKLLPLVNALSKKYTKNESSSISYHTAGILMEAVIYTINEAMWLDAEYEMSDHIKSEEITIGADLDYEALYIQGKKSIQDKLVVIKQTFENMVSDFDDYDCKNYRDTILKGIPEFLIHYDAIFEPQNHILTLDYPSLAMPEKECGVDLIYSYLKAIETEKRFLNQFRHTEVVQLLEGIDPEYRNTLMDNIAYPVLLNAIGCMIAGVSLEKLVITHSDCEKIVNNFEGNSFEEVKSKISQYINFIMLQTEEESLKKYFEHISHDYAIRIWNGLEYGAIERVFVTEITESIDQREKCQES